MKVPFSPEEFATVFKDYNDSIFPWQALLYAMGFLVFYFTFKKTKWSSKNISYILAFLWVWMGMVYHISFFTNINKAAYFFGILFVVQGILLILNSNLTFKFTYDVYGLVGSLMLAYAFVIYPAIGFAIGHVYPYSPTFGLPCPTTIFTFGVLLFSETRVPIKILIIPLLWSVVGTLAAFSLGFYEDFGLLAAAIIYLIMTLKKDKSREIKLS